MTAAKTHTSCTIGPSAVTGKSCGAASVVTGRSSDGSAWGCCAAHVTDVDRRAASGRGACGSAKVGDHVVVHRYGKSYDAIVSRVGARGGVWATFVYGNGARRTVRV